MEDNKIRIFVQSDVLCMEDTRYPNSGHCYVAAEKIHSVVRIFSEEHSKLTYEEADAVREDRWDDVASAKLRFTVQVTTDVGEWRFFRLTHQESQSLVTRLLDAWTTVRTSRGPDIAPREF